jgi:hypothetical protein
MVALATRLARSLYGHQLFFPVGAYWPDVTAFRDSHLKR